MKNRLFKTTTILVAAVIGSMSLVGCSKKVNKKDVLNIICLNRGYGRAWIDELVKIWEEENPGYTVHLDAIATADDLIKSHIYKSDNIDDLYIGNSKDWKIYAKQNKLLQLDDFLNETVDGVTVKNKINGEYGKSIKYNEHTYRLPWTSGVPGIYYNNKMFEKNGWTVPETYEEFVTLCSTIANAHIKIDPYGPNKDSNYVKPFIFSDQLYYFDYAVFTWWGQLAGKENVDNFLKYENADTFSTNTPGFNKLGEALQLWENIFSSSANYVYGSDGFDFTVAQQMFFQGSAAMMFNTDWIYNEILGYTDAGVFPEDFDIRLMKTPAASNAAQTNISYIVGEDNYFAIPKCSIKADLAKSFIKLMISDRGIKVFSDKARGTMAYKYVGGTLETEDPYRQSVIEYLNNATVRFTNWSDSKLYLTNQIDIWTDNDLKPYGRILNKTTGSATTSQYMVLLAKHAHEKWDQWVQQAGK